MKIKKHIIPREYYDQDYNNSVIYEHKIQQFVKDLNIQAPYRIYCGDYDVWVGDLNKLFGSCDCCPDIYSLGGDVVIYELVKNELA